MMKNKKQKHILTAIVSAVMVLCGCSAPAEPKTAEITNPVDIKYQKADMSGYEYLSEPIAEFREITLEESIRFFKEGGSGILYYGKDDCYWCNRAVPELNKVALEYGVPVYYVNTGISPMPPQETVKELVAYIEETFIVVEGEGPVFYVPEVIGVKQGKITGAHVSLVDSFEGTIKDKQLSDDQKKELQGYYRQIIEATVD